MKTRVTLVSLIASTGLTLVKAFAALISGSVGILAETLHSALDTLTGVFTYASVRYASKPPDTDHLYGHGKYESIGGLFGAIFLVITLLWVAAEAVKRLIEGVGPSANVIAVAVMVAAIVIDYNRARVLRRTGERYHSTALLADALHFSSDIYSSSAVLAGLILSGFGIWYADAIVALGVSAYFAYEAIGIARMSIGELTDRLHPEFAEKVYRLIREEPRVEDVVSFRARKVGPRLYVEATVKVESLLLEEAHAIASAIEERVKSAYPGSEVTIHVEPPESRRLVDNVKEIVLSHPKVKGLHHVTALDSPDNRVTISLHVEVPSDTPVDEAYRIASELEDKIKERVKECSAVIVHVEPHTESEELIESDVEAERRIINKLGKTRVPGLKRVERVKVTTGSSGAVYVNVDVVIDRKASLEEAHDITAVIEAIVRSISPNARVTVRFRPE